MQHTSLALSIKGAPEIPHHDFWSSTPTTELHNVTLQQTSSPTERFSPEPAAMDPETMAETDPDPIVASYPIFLNPSLPSNRKLYVLQHTNFPDDNRQRAAPVELRLKPRSGMLELDIPLDHSVTYDREKGQRWGRVLASSMAAKHGGSHGLAGGFGVGAPVGKKSRGEGEVDEMAYNLDWNEAVRQGLVLNVQTLGGVCPDTNDFQWMAGVFQGSKSPLSLHRISLTNPDS
jgi:DNA-directed RNA polymerase III subunit RPC5